MGNRKVLIDLHKHGNESSEMHEANLTPEEYLSYNYALAEINNFDIYTVCGSHNSTTWGKQVWDKYQLLDDKKHLHLFVQSEFTTDVSKILKYKDDSTDDERYVFKDIHLLAAAKRGREQEFFERTKVYSKLSDMYIKIDQTKELTFKEGVYPTKENDSDYIEIGQIIKGARNKLCDKYCKNQEDRIPFYIYKNLLENGLTYTEIRNRFIDDSFNYLVSRNLIENNKQAKDKLISSILTFQKKDSITNNVVTYDLFKKFTYEDQCDANKKSKPLKYYPKSYNKGLARLYLADIKRLFGDTAYFCIAHPSATRTHKNTGMPVSAFEGVDISYLSKQQQQTIKYYLDIYRKYNKDYVFTADDGNDIIEADKKLNIYIKNDKLSLVKNQILIKSLDKYASKYGFKIDGVEISPKMFTKYPMTGCTPKQFIWQHFDCYSKMGKAINCNSALGDTHLDFEKDAYLIDDYVSRSSKKRNYVDNLGYVCTKCSWLDLLQNDTFDKANQTLEIQPLKKCKEEHETL